MNAKKEILDHILEGEIQYVRVVMIDPDTYEPLTPIEGRLDEVLPLLDFEYDGGYGSQHLTGVIWWSDGTWSDRREYDGSEWWEHHARPDLPVNALMEGHDIFFNNPNRK